RPTDAAGPVHLPVRSAKPEQAGLRRGSRRHRGRSVLRSRLARLRAVGAPAGWHGRVRRLGLPALGVLPDRAAPSAGELPAAGAANVRREGRQDRPREPWPRPALPLRCPATATRLSARTETDASRRPGDAIPSAESAGARPGTTLATGGKRAARAD